jgi:hypothetical protein
MVLVLLRRLSRSTGFLNLDDLRKAPSGGEKGGSPFGDDVGRAPSGEENDLPPSGDDNGRFIVRRDLPPSGDENGRSIVRGERKDAVGPSGVGGR